MVAKKSLTMRSLKLENQPKISEIDFASLPEKTLAKDGRLSIKELYRKYNELLKAGWTGQQISSQEITVAGEEITVPIYAFFSPAAQKEGVLKAIVIAGIHGTEPAGPNAIAQYLDTLIKIGSQESVLLMPMCNPYGYYNDESKSPNGESVGDSDHLLKKNKKKPACREAGEITAFLMQQSERINSETKVLDLHEDNFGEDKRRHADSVGTYIYVHGERADKNPRALKIVKMLQDNLHPIIMEGETREKEKISGGMVINSQDGSIDQLLAEKLRAGLAIVLETYIIPDNDPPLEVRIKIHLEALNIFFGRSIASVSRD
jgi:hypothetical protein